MTTRDNLDAYEIGREGAAPLVERDRSSEDSDGESEAESQPGLGRLRTGFQSVVGRILGLFRGADEREIGADDDDDPFEQRESDSGDGLEDDPDAQPPVVKLSYLILLNALAKGATNIYLEIAHGNFTVTYRVNGNLAVEMRPPFKIAGAVTNRMKEMAQLDLAESRVQQEGEINLEIGGRRRAGFRVATVPSVYGDDLVLDLLYDRKALSVCD